MKVDINELVSSKQVAEMLGIQPSSMTQQRKLKGFPKPFKTFDKFSIWLRSDIKTWQARKESEA